MYIMYTCNSIIHRQIFLHIQSLASNFDPEQEIEIELNSTGMFRDIYKFERGSTYQKYADEYLQSYKWVTFQKCLSVRLTSNLIKYNCRQCPHYITLNINYTSTYIYIIHTALEHN